MIRNVFQQGIRFRYSTKVVQSQKPFSSRLLKFGVYSSGIVGVGYLADRYFIDSAVTRSLRTVFYSSLIILDNKFSDLPNHGKNADYLNRLISGNKGLYVKMGQLISMQSGMFPKEYQQVLKQFLDNAPNDDWAAVESILRSEMGADYLNLIELDHIPIASASIAQVHKGVWKPTGEKVAVKVQHESIPKQMNLDLLSYRLIMKMFGYAFDMPLSFVSGYVSDKLKEECDFNIEYNNGEILRSFIGNSSLKKQVLIPRQLYHTKRVLISEFIEGESFEELSKFNLRKIMNNLITCFSNQIFEWGYVHCDPHPGNFLIMKGDKLVILDHGLLVHLPADFKKQYCDFWKYLFELNFKEMGKIAISWGIGSPELFSGMMLAKPEILLEQMEKRPSEKEMNKFLRKQMSQFFENTDKFPLELIFLGRVMRMLQLLNLKFGSPSNRIGIMSAILIKNSTVSSYRLKAGGDSIRFNWKNIYNLVILRFVMLSSDIVYQLFRLKQFAKHLVGLEDQGIEVTLDKQANDTVKHFGFQLVDS